MSEDFGKATPRPWVVQSRINGEDGVGIIGLRLNGDGTPLPTPTNGLVAMAALHPTEIDAQDFERAEANAALIVAAVNGYDAAQARIAELEKALRLAAERLNGVAQASLLNGLNKSGEMAKRWAAEALAALVPTEERAIPLADICGLCASRGYDTPCEGCATLAPEPQP